METKWVAIAFPTTASSTVKAGIHTIKVVIIKMVGCGII
jgi:hypothetical protein